MTLLAQHGWGKSDKIDRGLADGSLDGIILSPRDESPDSLEAFASSLMDDDPHLTLFVDPQYYASTIMDPRLGRLLDYSYFRAELTYRDFVPATRISEIVREVIDYQIDLSTSHMCAPVVAFDSFNDRWSSIAVSMAAEAVSYYKSIGDDRPLLASLVINENAFRSEPEFQEFLDIVTDLECDGFYIIVRRAENEHRQGMEHSLLSPLLYMTHTLTTLNAFEVYFGYSDFLGIVLHAAGATGTACGWTQGLRRFTFGRFEQATGGRRPLDRYCSLPLLNTILINPELDDIELAGMLSDVLTGTPHDGVLNTRPPSSAHWPTDVQALHHWETLDDGITRVEDEGTPSDRFNELEIMIKEADDLYDQLEAAGQQLDGPSGAQHLGQWERAIEEFRERADI